MPVIYKITSPTNKIYIGQTVNIVKRKSRYKTLKCFKQRKLYSSLVKYGWKSHIFETIHELPEDVSQEVLNEYEIFYWQQYIDCGFEMLNIREPGSRGKNSAETRELIRKSNTGKPGYNKDRPGIRLGIKTLDSTKEKLKKTSSERTWIHKDGKQKRIKNDLLSSYYEDDWKKGFLHAINNNPVNNLDVREKIKNSLIGKMKGISNCRSKTIIQYYLDGRIKEIFNNISLANIITGINKHNITSVCTGKRKTAGGYIWKYSE